MNRKEWDRMTILTRVKQKVMTLVGAALAFGSPSPPLAPPPRIDGAITRSVEREKGDIFS